MRRANDAYFTPAWMTRALLHHVPEIRGNVLEPCAGDMSIVTVLRQAPGVYATANDIKPQPDCWARDASSPYIYDGVTFDWVITNPPYTMPTCTQIVENAIRHARVGVAMMLRISFKEPTAARNPRGPFLERHPISRELVMPRYSFTGNGKSDSATTAWMIWSKVPLSGPPMLSLYKADERFADPLPLEQSA
jgi:hypothetical protein